jgi:thiol-disulfide isomerase/thioredoxin
MASLARRLAALAAGAMLAAAAAAADPSSCEAPGRPAKLDFTLKDLDGRAVRLDVHRGKVILLDFWATWCAPCRLEVPGFVELQGKYGREGFIVLGVSVDETLAPVRRFVSEFGVNYPVLLGAGREDLQKAYGPLKGFPTAVLIGRDGRICRQHTGYTRKEVFEAQIRQLLKAARPRPPV